jgi:4-hydroxybenzoate polyprenyltransferase
LTANSRNWFLVAIDTLRPLDWLHFLSFPLAGVLVTTASLELKPVLPSIGVAACLLAYGYSFNNYHDHGKRQSSWWHRAPLFLALGFVPLLPLPGWAAMGSIILLSFTYSGPPRLKRIPVVGTLLNAAGFSAFCLLGVASPVRSTWALALFIACWIAAAQIVHELAHLSRDREDDLVTTASVIGSRGSRILAPLFLLAALAAAWQLSRFSGLSFLVYTVVITLLMPFLEAAALRQAMKWLGLLWAAAVVALHLVFAGR